MRGMRRTELACLECRRRKLKCEGTRPSCSRCQSRRLECSYMPLHKGSNTTKLGRERGDLLKKIEKLEEQLRAVTESRTAGVGMAITDKERRQEAVHCSDRTTVEDGAPVDVLSTNALTEETDYVVGYFGPSSNYAMFRLLSSIFAETTMLYLPVTRVVKNLSSCYHCEQRHNQASQTATCNLAEAGISQALSETSLPPKEEALVLFERYFSTTNFVLPYIDKAILLEGYYNAVQQRPPKFRRVLLALCNIVWALAAASFGSLRRETFYKKAVALLDSRTLERPSYELVQSLLLVVEYKQNHQRSISSYTSHALCVKAAFHVGLHHQATVTSSDSDETRLRLRLWEGVVKNDRKVLSHLLNARQTNIRCRIMGLTQGRPYMIPQCLTISSQALPGINSMISDLYMGHLARSHTIIEHATESLYNRDIEVSTSYKTHTLITQWTDLCWKNKEWSENLSTIGGLVLSSELAGFPVAMDCHTAVRILLSIHYYRLRMLVNFPLVAHFLVLLTNSPHEPQLLSRLRERLPQVLQNDWDAVRKLSRIISSLSTAHKTFINTFAAWYTCNYTMLTVTLHNFAMLVVKKHDPDVFSTASVAEIRQEIEYALNIMKFIGKNSLITQKAGCCIERLLTVFDTLGDHVRVRSAVSLDFWDADCIMRNIGQASDELLMHFSQDDFIDQDLSFLDLYSRLPLCE
ncbi:hypothetical protein BDV24DRAFT_177280 [Aspergillus arachidicola]|uniref:Zn(2)-C6 fungal-type domain-containing protein n=1 Tax=Aspergillus arachidicola TaxID=656916 RepID=A0A2G7EQ73_9EURO|nr:hypothetical protein BDV24DRAFT_177280 [Aspergillus arachidicola]PIG69601.1 hypothetical protein AARAC_002722 [Aspergillus arachidicola]